MRFYFRYCINYSYQTRADVSGADHGLIFSHHKCQPQVMAWGRAGVWPGVTPRSLAKAACVVGTVSIQIKQHVDLGGSRDKYYTKYTANSIQP